MPELGGHSVERRFTGQGREVGYVRNLLCDPKNPYSRVMVFVTAIGPVETLQCGRCECSATCLLHDARVLDGSTRVRFFCGSHLRSYLEEHPDLLEAALTSLGSDGLFAFYEKI